MLCGPHFNLFEKLVTKDLKPMTSLMISKIFDKKYKIFDKRSNKS